jgi:hypothetical protein
VKSHAINRDRPRDVVLTGTVNTLYDLRLRWQSLVGAPRAQRLTQYLGEHKHELRYPAYLQVLRESNVCLIGAGVASMMTLRKYMEVLASGAAIVGSVPADRLIAPFVQPTFLHWSDAELLAQIDSALALNVSEAERAHTIATRVFSYDTVFSSHIAPALRRFRSGQRGVWLTNTTDVQLTASGDTEQWCKTKLNGQVSAPSVCTVEYTSVEREAPDYPWCTPMDALRTYVLQTINDAEHRGRAGYHSTAA